MNLCNETVTVINAVYDPATGYDTYQCTVIGGVSWFFRDTVNVDTKGLQARDGVTVRIPVDAHYGGTYTAPREFEASSSKVGKFTLRPGDVIARGTVQSVTRLADLRGMVDEYITITSVTDNRRAPNAKHWKVVGQ